MTRLKTQSAYGACVQNLQSMSKTWEKGIAERGSEIIKAKDDIDNVLSMNKNIHNRLELEENV